MNRTIALSLFFVTWVMSPVLAQDPYGLYQPRRVAPPAAPLRMQDYSWTYVDPIPPRVVKVQDIITIIVDEQSEVTMTSDFNRQRTGTFASEINEFVRLGETGNLLNSAANQPAVDTSQNGRMQNRARLIDTEGVRYRIAATVVDIHPNGNLVLEARKTIRSNDSLWNYTLSGVMRSIDVFPNNTALSENIANLQITKKQAGQVYDSTKARWGTRFFDKLWPF